RNRDRHPPGGKGANLREREKRRARSSLGVARQQRDGELAARPEAVLSEEPDELGGQLRRFGHEKILARGVFSQSRPYNRPMKRPTRLLALLLALASPVFAAN